MFRNDVAVSGCWFHFARALVKRMCTLVLTDACQNDSHTQTVFQGLLSLPLLPFGDIMPAFDEVISPLDDQSPSKTMMQQLIRYVSRQSIIGPSRLSVRDSPSRTNNAVESFHAALRRRIKVSYPNLFAFLGHLQQTTIDSKEWYDSGICGITAVSAVLPREWN